MKFFQSAGWRRWYLVLVLGLLLPVLIPQAHLSPRSANWSDAEGYYLYLPAVFTWPSVHQIHPESVGTKRNARGEHIIKYTCGVALFEAPLFLLAQFITTRFKGVDRADVFHPYYGRAIYATAFLIVCVGLLILQRALRAQGFAEPIVALTLIGTLYGTNLFHYVVREPGMSHVYSFTLLAIVLWLTPRFYARPSFRRAALLGACCGWLVLLRPTVVLALPLVVLYGVYSVAELRARLAWLAREWRAGLVTLGAGGLFLTPQLWYWYEMTGRVLYYSYGDEGFTNWARPKLLAVLFDTQNGLFVYSPLVLVSVGGLVWGWRDRRVLAPLVLAIFGVLTYVFASWWAWWFGGAFGHRCYVEYYALLALPLAFSLEKIWGFPARWRAAALGGLFFLVFYSVRMDFLYRSLPQPWDGPAWRWNWEKIVFVWSHLFRF